MFRGIRVILFASVYVFLYVLQVMYFLIFRVAATFSPGKTRTSRGKFEVWVREKQKGVGFVSSNKITAFLAVIDAIILHTGRSVAVYQHNL